MKLLSVIFVLAMSSAVLAGTLAVPLPVKNSQIEECLRLEIQRRASLNTDEKSVNDFTARLPQKYPTLSVILKDPEAFRIEMEKRFEAAKRVDPEHPLAFDYSEIGMTALKEMDSMIPGKLEEWKKMKEEALNEGVGPFWMPKKLVRLLPKSKRLELGRQFASEIDIGTKYLSDLKQEIDSITKSGHVNYDRSLEVNYFFSRAIGHFDRFNFSDKLKALMYTEYKVQGYKDHPMAQEYQLYKDREFSFGEYPSIDKSTRISLAKLEADFANKNKLLPIFVPTSAPLELDIFYRLEPYYIYPIGFTDVPIPADGVLRHSGLFSQHDMGHSAVMYRRTEPYFRDLTKKQARTVRVKLANWYDQFEKDVAKIQDPELRGTVELLSFNIHHERGYPFAPSTYTRALKRVPNTTYVIYFFMEQTGQGLQMGKRPYLKIAPAFKWLKDYWSGKQVEEDQMFSSMGIDSRTH